MSQSVSVWASVNAARGRKMSSMTGVPTIEESPHNRHGDHGVGEDPEGVEKPLQTREKIRELGRNRTPAHETAPHISWERVRDGLG